MGIQKYVGRLTKSGRTVARHSSFWIGLLGQSWVLGIEYCQEIVVELMKIRPNKLLSLQKGMRAMSLISLCFNGVVTPSASGCFAGR